MFDQAFSPHCMAVHCVAAVKQRVRKATQRPKHKPAYESFIFFLLVGGAEGILQQAFRRGGIIKTNILNDPAVLNSDDSVGICRDSWIMRDNDNSPAGLIPQTAKLLQYFLPSHCVQISRRFICQNDVRLLMSHEQWHPLLLPPDNDPETWHWHRKADTLNTSSPSLSIDGWNALYFKGKSRFLNIVFRRD